MAETPLAATPAPSSGSSAQRPDDILVAFAGSARQRRLTVLVRALLLIPHAIVLIALTIAVYVVVVIGWFAALVMGRLPAWAARFLTGWLRYYARVAGYLWLLTDTYPPFALGDADYPVHLAVAPGRLNRLAVLFRLILAIPVLIVAALVSQGVGSVALLVIWLIVLIGGRMPDALYQAVAAILRFVIRTDGYLFLLTATYPHGLFGDKPGGETDAVPAAGPVALPPAAGAGPAAVTDPGREIQPLSAEPPSAEPPSAERVSAEPGDGGPGYGQPDASGPLPPASGPRGWRLVLSDAARNLVIMFLVLGVGVAILDGYLNVTYPGVVGFGLSVRAGTYAQAADAALQIGAANRALVGTMNGLQAKTAACQDITCVNGHDLQAARVFDAFGSALRSAGVPGGAAAAANTRLEQDVVQIAADFRKLATATTGPQYQQILASSGLQQALARYNADYRKLGVALGVVKP